MPLFNFPAKHSIEMGCNPAHATFIAMNTNAYDLYDLYDSYDLCVHFNLKVSGFFFFFFVRKTFNYYVNPQPKTLSLDWNER